MIYIKCTKCKGRQLEDKTNETFFCTTCPSATRKDYVQRGELE